MKFYSVILVLIGLHFVAFCKKTDSSKNLSQEIWRNGKVADALNAKRYTYIEIEENGKKIWIATSFIEVKKDDVISFVDSPPMKNFETQTLKRKFDEIIFTSKVIKGRALSGVQKGDLTGFFGSSADHTAVEKSAKIEKIPKPAGGFTIAEIYAQKEKLKGQTIRLSGKVVKVNEGILGKNWIHLQDGSGDQSAFDIAVTTKETVKLNEILTVSGILALDKNIGGGYNYAVLVEDAVRVK